MKLVIRSDLQACVVDGGGRVLVPDQLLTGGTEDGPYVARRFKVELDPADARIMVNGEPARAADPSNDAAGYTVSSAGGACHELHGQAVPVSVRGGIIVTGTEVLTGRITDRNGPWISERLEEQGVDVAHIITVGDRPDDLEAALRFLASEGMALIVTSGGLGPTADDLTAEIVGRFAGRELVLDEEMEEKIAAILRKFARRYSFDPEAMREANRKQALVPEGRSRSTRRGRRPASWCRRTAPSWSCSARRASCTRSGHERSRPSRCARCSARADSYATTTLRMFGIPESELAKTLREIEEEIDLSPLEITTCLRQAELVVDIRHLPEDEALSNRVIDAIADRHGRFVFSRDGESIDDQVAELLTGHRIGLAESSTGGCSPRG